MAYTSPIILTTVPRFFHRRANDGVVTRQRHFHPRGFGLPEPGAALDVGEQKRRDGGGFVHRIPLREALESRNSKQKPARGGLLKRGRGDQLAVPAAASFWSGVALLDLATVFFDIVRLRLDDQGRRNLRCLRRRCQPGSAERWKRSSRPCIHAMADAEASANRDIVVAAINLFILAS
jgi:hypothetical protein